MRDHLEELGKSKQDQYTHHDEYPAHDENLAKHCESSHNFVLSDYLG